MNRSKLLVFLEDNPRCYLNQDIDAILLHFRDHRNGIDKTMTHMGEV
jgi:hypothetical protein